MIDPRIEIYDMIWDISNKLNELTMKLSEIPHEIEEYEMNFHMPCEGDYMHPDTPTHAKPEGFGEDAYWDAPMQVWMEPSQWEWDEHDMFGNGATDYCYDGDAEEWMWSEEPDWSNDYHWEMDHGIEYDSTSGDDMDPDMHMHEDGMEHSHEGGDMPHDHNEGEKPEEK